MIRPGRFAAIYANMPSFGLGRAGVLEPAVGGMESAAKWFREKTACASDATSPAPKAGSMASRCAR